MFDLSCPWNSSNTWIVGGAELLVGAVAAVVVRVAAPRLQDAAGVVALELVGLAAGTALAVLLV
jgi:hypothetical protein